MKSVHKISKAKFMVTTLDLPNSELQLDFNPIIEQFKLSGNYYLIHWQARPKGHREYGIYTSVDDSYRSTDNIPTSYGGMACYQLDDKTANTIPSAVICFKGYLR